MVETGSEEAEGQNMSTGTILKGNEGYESELSIPPPSSPASLEKLFSLFPKLPAELRAPIWKHALTRRIVKWTRTNDKNVFTVSKKSFPLFHVCQESRKIAMLYGQYIDISTSGEPVYFSPLIDHLLFEPIWTDLIPKLGSTVVSDPIESLPPNVQAVRNIMVHPHYTDERKRPTALLERLHNVEQVLVAADEKSIGFQSKFILGTAYDLKLYYAADVRKRIPDFKIPYIAVGCLGWTGVERRKMHHGSEDTRELVKVCENEVQMKEHLKEVREEERRFMLELQKGRPGLKLKLNFKTLDGTGKMVEKIQIHEQREASSPTKKVDPPTYSGGQETAPEDPPPYVDRSDGKQ